VEQAFYLLEGFVDEVGHCLMFVDGMRVSVASRHIHQEYFISYRLCSWILEVNDTLDAVEQGNSPDLGC
jgi:hypothetical protein